MSSILITNALIVNEGHTSEGDVLVRDGRIDRIDTAIGNVTVDTVIDARGKALMPGMIDDQVHFRDPGLIHKADLRTESMAAVAGGITSFMDMPNTKPPATTRAGWEEKMALGAEKSLANYAFHFGTTNDNLDEIRAIDPARVSGVKVFMGASTGNMLVDNEETLGRVFADSPIIILTHCEDTPTILENERRFREQYGDDVPMKYHPAIRSAEACYKSSSLAVELARANDARLHVLHLTTARELELFSDAPLSEKKITVEACVHHLYFDERDYADLGTLIKCNPAIKTPADRQALVQAVIDGKVDIIGTDHAPHTLDEKDNPYFKAPAGLPLVQWALPSLLEQHFDGRYSLELIAEKTAHNVATLFEIEDRGFIREGYWADLVLVDLEKPQTVQRGDVLSKCAWSPFEGRTFRASIDTTLVSGQIAYRHGEVNLDTRGQALRFDRK